MDEPWAPPPECDECQRGRHHKCADLTCCCPVSGHEYNRARCPTCKHKMALVWSKDIPFMFCRHCHLVFRVWPKYGR